MKKNIFFVILLSAVVLSASINVEAGENYQIQLEACGLDIPVLFEDQYLSDEVKETVIEDYRLIHGHFKAYLFRSYNSGEAVVEGKKIQLSYAIDFKEGYRISPDGYDFNTIAVDLETQDKYLFIYKNLSDAYKRALAIKAKNETAFAKLDEFIDFMNNVNEVKLPDSLDKLLYLPGEAQEFNGPFDENNSAEYRDGYGRYEYKKSSSLEFRTDEEYCDGNLITNIIMVLKSAEPPKANEQLVIYHDGRWKFVNIWLLE